MQALLDNLQRVLTTVLKHRWLALGVGAVAAAVFAAAISQVPDLYRAKARVYVDTQSVLKPLMAALTYQPDVDQQVQMLARTLISRPNVERLIDENGSDPGSRATGAAREALIARLMDQIVVVPTGAGNLYEISYRDATPLQAQRLVQATLDLFTRTGSGAKRLDSQHAGQFIDEQIHSYETKLAQAENRLKNFKMEHFGESGVADQDYYLRMSNLSEEVTKLKLEFQAADQARVAYRRELTTEEPQLPPELAPRSSGGPALQEAQARLETQRLHLDELRGRYTEQHPEVIAAQRALQQFEQETRERKLAEDRAVARYGKTATSPVYQRLRILLAEAEAQVAALRSQLAMKQQRLAEVRAVAGKAPQVEAELTQLNRDYDIVRKSYDAMVARRESALLGQRLDESAQLTDFRVIEPPRVSHWPTFPGRLYLALLALLVAPALGIGAAVLAEEARPTLDDAKSLQQLSLRPVLGTVSWIGTGDDQRTRRRARLGFIMALNALLVLQAGWFAWAALMPAIRQAAS